MNNSNIEHFLQLLSTSDAITLHDGAFITDITSEKVTGLPDNELVHIRWTEGDLEMSVIFNEDDISRGAFSADGTFSTSESGDGDIDVIRFFKFQQLNIPTESQNDNPPITTLSRDDIATIMCVPNVHDNGATWVDYGIDVANASIRDYLKKHPSINTEKNQNVTDALLFWEELTSSVNGISAIGEEHGMLTLAAIMSLQNAILKETFIDFYPGESKLLEVLEPMASNKKWVKFVTPVNDGIQSTDEIQSFEEVFGIIAKLNLTEFSQASFPYIDFRTDWIALSGDIISENTSYAEAIATLTIEPNEKVRFSYEFGVNTPSEGWTRKVPSEETQVILKGYIDNLCERLIQAGINIPISQNDTGKYPPNKI